MNFAQQSEELVRDLTTRNCGPIKPATLQAYNSYLKNHVLPLLGAEDLATFNNGGLRKFARDLQAKGLGPKSITEVVSLTKQIVASAVSPDGVLLYPREWNHKFIDLPPVVKQKQPTVTDEQLAAALKDRYGVFYAILAGTGLRIGEATAVRYGWDGVHTGWDPTKAAIDVRLSLWGRQEQDPKTPAAVRIVDLDPKLNEFLVGYTASRTLPAGAYLFQTSEGTPLWESHLKKYSLKPLGIKGFHAFRRLRITRLREIGVPEDIIRYWVGHEGQGITDRYSKLGEKEELRKQWAAKAGLGFTLPKEIA
jgi:integrase